MNCGWAIVRILCYIRTGQAAMLPNDGRKTKRNIIKWKAFLGVSKIDSL